MILAEPVVVVTLAEYVPSAFFVAGVPGQEPKGFSVVVLPLVVTS